MRARVDAIPGSGTSAGPAHWPEAVWALLREWYRRSSQRQALRQMLLHDRRTLRDIGQTPTHVRAEIDKWFWQP